MSESGSKDGVYQIGVEVTADNIDTNVNKVKSGLVSIGDEADKTKGKLGGMGDGIAPAVEKLTAAEKSMAASMQRTIAANERLSAEMQAGSKNTVAYYESLSSVRNVDFSKLDGLSAKLKEVSTATTTLAEANKKAASQNDFLSGLQKQAEAVGKTRADLLELQAAQLGVSQSAAPMIAALRAQESGLLKVGMSAGQLNNSLRQVPAQFTDIFVSLASGQQPLTVFLQQGGQLKDMFGGAGAAAKAMGGYVLSLINPMTVAAATVGTVAFAYHQGNAEAEAFRKTLILSGNAAGMTSAQMADMAGKVAASTGSTTGAVAEIINQLAMTGKVASGQMGEVSAAIAKMSKVSGIAVDDLVKEFASLADDPVKAIQKLDEKYNLLTIATYEQIKALQDQGKEFEAAAKAQDVFAKSMEERADALKDNLGSVETAWKGVSGAAKSAWDSMLDIGREMSPQRVKFLEMILAGDRQGAMWGGARMGDVLAPDTEIRAMLAVKKAGDEAGESSAKAEQSAKRTKDAYIALGDSAAKFASDTDKKQREMLLATERYKTVIADTKTTQEERNKAEKFYLDTVIGINREKDKQERKGGKSQAAKDKEELESLLNRINGKDSGFDAGYIKDVEVLSREYGKGKLSLEKFNDEFARLIKQQPGYTKDLREQIAAQKEFETSRIKYIESVEKETESLINKANAAEFENAKIGATEAQLAELVRARDESTLAALREKAATIEAVSGRNWEVEQIEAQIEALKRLQSAEVARPKLQQQAKEWEKFSDDINRALTDALMRGFESGKGFGENFVDSLKNSLKTAALKLVVNVVTSTGGSLVNSAINAVRGTSGSNGGSGTNYFGLASNANSMYNLYNGSYLASAQSAYNTYAAGANIAGYTAPYWQTAAGAALANAATPSGLGYGMSLAPATSTIPGVAPTYGMSAAPTTTGASASGLGAGSVAWVAAIAAGMYMSSEAWKSGIRWENYASGSDAKKYDAEVGMRAMTDKPMEALFGKNFVNSEFYAVMSGSALSAQIHMALQKSLWGTGYQSTGISSLRGAFSESAGGFSGGQAGMEFSSSGGLFRGSNDKKTEWQGISDGFGDMLDNMYMGIRNTYVLSGAVFDDHSIAKKLSGWTQDVLHTNTTDMKASLKLMSEVLAQGMGSFLFPSIDALKRTASADGKVAVESWSEAFGRVMQEASAVSRVFDLMGTKMSAAFGKDNADGILRISDAFVSAFGSIDALNQSFGKYYKEFYSAAEQEAQARKDVAAGFAAMNIAMPETRAGFRALVDAAAQAGNPTLYKGLLDLSEGFAAITPAVEQAVSDVSKLRETLLGAYSGKLSLSSAKQKITDAGGAELLNINSSEAARAMLASIVNVASDVTLKTIDSLSPAITTWLDSLDAAAARQAEILSEREGLEKVLLGMQKNTAELRSRELLTLDESNRALQSRIWALEDEAARIEIVRSATLASFEVSRAALQSFSSAGMENITRVVDLEKQRIGVVRSVAVESVTSIKNVFSLLTEQVNQIYSSVSSSSAGQAIEGSAFIANALANAKSTGYLPDRDALSSAISAARGGLDENNFATQFEADRAALVMAGQLSQLKDISGQQLPAAEQAVKIADEQLKALDDSLGFYKKQLDQLLGINDNTLNFTGTVQQVGEAIVSQLSGMASGLSSNIVSALKGGSITASDASGQLKSSGVVTDAATKLGGSNAFVSSKGASIIDGMVYATNGFKGSLTEAKDEVLKAFNTLPPKDFQAAAISVGLSAAMIDQMFSLTPGQSNRWALENNLPSFDVGTNYLPRDMIAQLHEGEAIVPKAYNPAINGGVSNDRMERLVEALTAEVQRLQALVEINNGHASRTANGTNGNPDQPIPVETV